ASFDQGYVADDGFANGAYNGNNTFTGIEGSRHFSSWAAFSIPAGIYGTATLQVRSDTWPFGSPAVYEIGIFDVTTPLAVLAARTSGIAGYDDLGSGNEYASALLGFDPVPVAIGLDDQAVADINAAAGGVFIVGFTNETTNAVTAVADALGIYP